jgi:hypothetical protein
MKTTDGPSDPPLIEERTTHVLTRMLKWSAYLALSILAVGQGSAFFASETTPSAEQWKPRWCAGDRWIVKTTSRGLERRAAPVESKDPITARWEFSVKKTEKLAGHDCHRLEVRCLDEQDRPDEQQPLTVLWVDCKAMVLRQCRMQIPVPDGFRAITESYAFADGQPAPVVAPFTALPVDLPLFSAGLARGGEKFSYEAIDGVGGSRAADDVAFGIEVEQHVAPARAEDVKRLLPADLSRGLEVKQVVEVKLRAADREVRQLWQAGQPWPVYASNGSTTAHLVKVTSAGAR